MLFPFHSMFGIPIFLEKGIGNDDDALHAFERGDDNHYPQLSKLR